MWYFSLNWLKYFGHGNSLPFPCPEWGIIQECRVHVFPCQFNNLRGESRQIQLGLGRVGLGVWGCTHTLWQNLYCKSAAIRDGGWCAGAREEAQLRVKSLDWACMSRGWEHLHFLGNWGPFLTVLSYTSPGLVNSPSMGFFSLGKQMILHGCIRSFSHCCDKASDKEKPKRERVWLSVQRNIVSHGREGVDMGPTLSMAHTLPKISK